MRRVLGREVRGDRAFVAVAAQDRQQIRRPEQQRDQRRHDPGRQPRRDDAEPRPAPIARGAGEGNRGARRHDNHADGGDKRVGDGGEAEENAGVGEIARLGDALRPHRDRGQQRDEQPGVRFVRREREADGGGRQGERHGDAGAGERAPCEERERGRERHREDRERLVKLPRGHPDEVREAPADPEPARRVERRRITVESIGERGRGREAPQVRDSVELVATDAIEVVVRAVEQKRLVDRGAGCGCEEAGSGARPLGKAARARGPQRERGNGDDQRAHRHLRQVARSREVDERCASERGSGHGSGGEDSAGDSRDGRAYRPGSSHSVRLPESRRVHAPVHATG